MRYFTLNFVLFIVIILNGSFISFLYEVEEYQESRQSCYAMRHCIDGQVLTLCGAKDLRLFIIKRKKTVQKKDLWQGWDLLKVSLQNSNFIGQYGSSRLEKDEMLTQLSCRIQPETEEMYKRLMGGSKRKLKSI